MLECHTTRKSGSGGITDRGGATGRYITIGSQITSNVFQTLIAILTATPEGGYLSIAREDALRGVRIATNAEDNAVMEMMRPIACQARVMNISTNAAMLMAFAAVPRGMDANDWDYESSIPMSFWSLGSEASAPKESPDAELEADRAGHSFGSKTEHQDRFWRHVANFCAATNGPLEKAEIRIQVMPAKELRGRRRGRIRGFMRGDHMTQPGGEEEWRRVHDGIRRLREAIAKVIVGQEAIVTRMLIALLCRGHCLIIGVPGLAKTLLVSTLGRALGLSFRRIQFTPDLMPMDILGSEILQSRDSGRREFEFCPGPVFANLILADEINRTPPKTQSALLEAMQEKQVSVAGRTMALEEPFVVYATQNPIEHEGTYRCPRRSSTASSSVSRSSIPR